MVASFTEINDDDELDDFLNTTDLTDVVIIQFTASFCKRCVILKEEIAATFSETMRWVVVDVDESQILQSRFNVTQLPRVDVYCKGVARSLVAFDATIEKVRTLVEEVDRGFPMLDLSADF